MRGWLVHDWRRFILSRAQVLLVFCGLCALLAQTGRWHWFPELLTHFSVIYGPAALLFTLLLYWTRAHWVWSMGGALLALSLFLVAWHPYFYAMPTRVATVEDSSRTELTLLQFNAAGSPEGLTNWVLSSGDLPDVILILEAGSGFEALARRMKAQFPHQLLRLQDDPFGILLLSRYPFLQAQVIEPAGAGHYPALDVTLAPKGQAVRILGIHPPPPLGQMLADDRNRFMAGLVPGVSGLSGGVEVPVVLLGDFNSTHWSPWMQDFMEDTGLRDAEQGVGPLATWPSWLAQHGRYLGLPIDLMLISDGVQIRARSVGPDLGSDHLPVLTRIQY